MRVTHGAQRAERPTSLKIGGSRIRSPGLRLCCGVMRDSLSRHDRFGKAPDENLPWIGRRAAVPDHKVYRSRETIRRVRTALASSCGMGTARGSPGLIAGKALET